MCIRKLTFGPEENYTKCLGYWFTGLTMKNVRHLFKEGMVYSEAGRTAILYGTKNLDTVTAFLVHYDTEPPFVDHRDEKEQKEVSQKSFR